MRSCNDLCDAFDVYCTHACVQTAAFEPVMSAGSPPLQYRYVGVMSGRSLFLCLLLCAIYEGLLPPCTLGNFGSDSDTMSAAYLPFVRCCAPPCYKIYIYEATNMTVRVIEQHPSQDIVYQSEV